MNKVVDKTALITGANRGIGKAIVEKFMSAGIKKIYAAARNINSLSALINHYGDRIVPLQIDLNSPATITQAALQAKDVDLVVNNAGVLELSTSLSKNAVAALKNEMEVNVYGLIRIAQAFAPVLKENGGGVFAQINSVASYKNFADFSTYSASKAAAYSITQGLRTKLMDQGTQIISVHPGPIMSDMAKKAGITEIAQPAELVAESIIEALESKDFHAYPDSMAKEIGGAYASFASSVIEAVE